MTDETQALIEQRANNGPRVTPADIEANILSEHYFTAENGARGAAMLTEQGADLRGAYSVEVPLPLCLLTFCVLVLRNGFTVTGESACAAPENFDAEIGCKVARQNALNKIWPLMGYALRSEISKGA